MKGKELLLDIISNTYIRLNNLNNSYYDLYELLSNDINNLANMSDEEINDIIIKSDYSKAKVFNKRILQLRDLLLGKKDYNLSFNINNDHQKTYKTFLSLIEKIINEDNSEILTKKDTLIKLDKLKESINNNEIINDYDFISNITYNYNKINYDENMLSIIEYITTNNKDLLNINSNIEVNNFKEIKLLELDEEVNDILNKLEINDYDIPKNLMGILKETPKEDIISNYNIIRKNKVEDYGILHLIDRSSSYDKLIILLFANEESIKGVIDALRDNNSDINANIVRIVLNTIIPAFIIKSNDFVSPKYYDFIENIKLFKSLDINIDNIINRNPLLLIVNNENLTTTLDISKRYGYDPKKIVLKLHKVLTINMNLIIDNLNILNNLNLKDDTYNLLKVVNLDTKIKYIKEYYNKDILSCDEIYKLIIKYIYENIDNNMIWK